MYEFSYHRPQTLERAVNLLDENDDAKVIAGGHSLLPVMKQRLAGPAHLIDISHIPGLGTIEVCEDPELREDRLRIGAMARHADVAACDIVRALIPALAALAGQIGDPAVRHLGTIGGSLAGNDPAADYAAAVVALKATIVTNRRSIGVDDYFQGLFATALEGGEIITHVLFPRVLKAAYVKFASQASRYALVGVFVAQLPDEVRVAVTGAGRDGVFRVGAFEEALSGRFSSRALAGITVSENGLNSDIHASAEYRAHLIGVLARRAVDAANLAAAATQAQSCGTD
ncbi:MAG: xanthine dehydrogenase family protein subunit M [Alphaproteobacteria bacterium]|nr:xanthine dehydrogenase family protein subunit M [Alphaproteobacteria bacterium]